MKRFLYYIGCTIIIGFIFYLGAKYQASLQQKGREMFEMRAVLVTATIFPIAIGIILRLPKLIAEIKNNTEWKFDWIKITTIGIPALYVAILPALSTTNFGISPLFADKFMTYNILITVAGIVFGYVLLDSFKKQE